MKTILLYDTDHVHQESLTLGRKPKYIDWIRDTSFKGDVAFYTNRQILRNIDKDFNFAIVTEPRVMVPDVCNYLEDESNAKRFDEIYTHDSVLLSKLNNTKWIPGNGVWYKGPTLNKVKNISMLCSNKNMTHMHNVRRTVAAYAQKTSMVDVMGTFCGPHIELKEAFQDYRYNICIENYIDNGYFSEKLTNCFASMTVPIYMGASIDFLSKIFDIRGIIFIDKLSQIDGILNSCCEKDYYNRKNAIISNYNIVQSYLSIEDYICEKYWGYSCSEEDDK